MSVKKYQIKLNGKMYEVEIEEVTTSNIVNKSNETENDSSTANIEKNKNTNSNGEIITAPMPGTIVNVLVKSGQSVKKGQVVAILEAMKMENEIVSPIDGKIEMVNVDKGQNVSLGDSLLKIS